MHIKFTHTEKKGRFHFKLSVTMMVDGERRGGPLDGRPTPEVSQLRGEGEFEIVQLIAAARFQIAPGLVGQVQQHG